MNDHEGYYHICTDGLSRKLLFRDRNDYIHGMNDIPACLQLIEGEIICFSLMPNHVHFIVHTSAENAKRFIENYKKRLSGRLMRKYNEPHSLSRLGTLIKDIDSEDYLKTAIAYVLRNPLAANMVCLPNTYRWSSGYLYFRQSEITLCTNWTKRLGELTRRKIWEYTGVRTELPENYTIDNEGVILPENYNSSARVTRSSSLAVQRIQQHMLQGPVSMSSHSARAPELQHPVRIRCTEFRFFP